MDKTEEESNISIEKLKDSFFPTAIGVISEKENEKIELFEKNFILKKTSG